MGGEPVPVTARFSNGGGDPGIPDYAKEGRGLAVKFYLPDGSKTDIVALSLPCFFVRTPGGLPRLHAAAQARSGDRPARLREARRVDGEAPGGRARDPGGADRRTRRRATRPWPTTRSTPSGGRRRTGPSGGCATASSPRRASGRWRRSEARALGRDYLQEEIVARESSAFRLVVIVANDGDAVNDPTVAWPADRERVEVGRLELSGPGDGARAGRRHPRLRPHPRDRRHRPERRPDPALPPARVRGVGDAAERRAGAGLGSAAAGSAGERRALR